MKILKTSGEEVLSAELVLSDEKLLGARVSLGEGAIDLTVPTFIGLALEGTKEGLLLQLRLPELEGASILIEHKDVKALRALPEKGLMKFALKALI